MRKFLTGQIDKFRAKKQREGLPSALKLVLRKIGLTWREDPYDYVQTDVQRHLHQYLRVTRSKICRIVIVGAHLGREVKQMLRQYPNAEFLLFEPSPRYISKLKQRFSLEERVQIHECAISDIEGSMDFFETNLEGSGSLLQIGDLARDSYGMKQAESFPVVVTSLDSMLAENGGGVDCLWIDVQGAEMGVLRGSSKVLSRTAAVFIEVSVFNPLYEGGALFRDIEIFLWDYGFKIVSLGTDAANGTGNAFFVRAPEV